MRKKLAKPVGNLLGDMEVSAKASSAELDRVFKRCYPGRTIPSDDLRRNEMIYQSLGFVPTRKQVSNAGV